MLLGVLGCIDFTMNLSKSLMWHIFIGWCKPKGLYSVLIEFNFIYINIYECFSKYILGYVVPVFIFFLMNR